VIAALRAVPYGGTISYGELAARAGAPRAGRAAGSVCARGTVPIVVPYHRVIRSDGSIGSYGPSGERTKRRLLALEGRA
jgi:methylated-DNA-[protein]-cysteine S-methyltransferase